MPRNELHPITHPDYHTRRGGEHIGAFADGKVNLFDSADPRLEIDIVVDNHAVRLIVDENPIFDYHPCKLDKIEIYRSHHRRVAIQVGESVQYDNGTWKHEVYSSHGFIGYAFGKRNATFGFYLASRFYRDPQILKLTRGHGRFDKAVQADLEKQFGTPGLFK